MSGVTVAEFDPSRQRAQLGVMVGAVMAAAERAWQATELDAGFDGGEWSGPAHERALAREVRELCSWSGWTVQELTAAAIERTSVRWVHFSGLAGVLELAAGEAST